MKRMTVALTLAGLCVCAWHTSPAANEAPAPGVVSASTRDSVIVQSRRVTPGDSNVVIGIRIVNAMPVMGLTVPLEFRAVTPGAFVTRAAVGFRERLTTALSGTRFANHYAQKDYICPDTKLPGYRDIVASEIGRHVPVTASPWGVMVSAFRFLPNPSLAAGADSTGSLTLTVDVTTTKGTFEIDTACAFPTNHLMLVAVHQTGDLSGLIPVFVKGVITIGQCDCAHHGDINGDGTIDAIDYSSVMDHVFFGGAAPVRDSSCPHVNRGDFNCDGKIDICDVLHLRDHMYGSGVAACNPCAMGR